MSNQKWRTLLAVMLVAIGSVSSSAEPVRLQVWIDVSVTNSGSVEAAEIIETLPKPIEDYLSAWVAELQFEAATVDGLPVPSTTSV